MKEEEAFWSRVTIPSDVITGCWLWTGSRTPRGHGYFRKQPAYRWSYLFCGGAKIPWGWMVDHLCNNPRCVNPNHLEAVSQSTNTRRAMRLYKYWGRRPKSAAGDPEDNRAPKIG